MRTAINEMVKEMSVKPISFDPLSADCIRLSPASRCRAIFSNITIASSTTKPVAMVSAIKVRLLTEKPKKYISTKVPMIDSGTAILGIMVADKFLRKRKVTMTTKQTAKTNSFCTSWIELRILSVRSVSTRILTFSGRFFCSSANSCLI